MRNHNEIYNFCTQNLNNWGKLSFTDFTFHTNGDKWNHFHASWKTHFPQVYICYCKTSWNLHENSETKQRESSEVLGRSLKFDMKSAKMPNIELIFTQLQVLTTLKFFSLSFSIFFLKPISQLFSIKNSNDLIGWFLLWREKKLSRNLGYVKVEEISFELFEGLMVNLMLGTKIILIKYDVKIYAKQNYIHFSSNF